MYNELNVRRSLPDTQLIQYVPLLLWTCSYFTVLQTQGITDLLMAPAKLKHLIPNISGTRNLSDNISDLKAQVAANNRGISLVKELIAEYSLDIVQAYMTFIQVTVLQKRSASRRQLCNSGASPA